MAPLSGRERAFWTVVIEERGLSNLWSTVPSEQGGADFYVRDESGRALVRLHADHTDASLTQDARFTSGLFNEAGPQLEAFLAKHGASSKGGLFNMAPASESRSSAAADGSPIPTRSPRAPATEAGARCAS